ncbi:Protein Jade-1 [Xylographa soralifera]|nr:Protein Jade-1 [Xylographa soralifera]
MSTTNLQPRKVDTTCAATTTNHEQLPRASAPDLPAGYKFVKVKKPDGTIVKVKRRITPPSDVAAPNPALAILPEAPTEVPRETITQATSSIAAVPKVISSQVSQKENARTLSQEVKSKTTASKVDDVEEAATEAKPKLIFKTVNHKSTFARTSRLFRGARRVHRHFDSIVGTFDSNGDLGDLAGDAGDFDADSHSDSGSSCSSDDNRGRSDGRRKSSVANNRNDSASVYSYADAESEYERSDNDSNVKQSHEVGSQNNADRATDPISTSHSRRHGTTKAATSGVTQITMSTAAQERAATNASAS